LAVQGSPGTLLFNGPAPLDAAFGTAGFAGDGQRDLVICAPRPGRERLARATAVAPIEVVRFGTGVWLRFEDRTEWALRVVGEDEGDRAPGLVSWAASLAKTLTAPKIEGR